MRESRKIAMGLGWGWTGLTLGCVDVGEAVLERLDDVCGHVLGRGGVNNAGRVRHGHV